MLLNSFAEVFQAAKAKGRQSVVIADADDSASLEAAIEARKIGIADAILVGNQDKIAAKLKDLGNGEFDIRNADSEEEIASLSVEIVKDGEGKAILKGHLSTPALLKAVLAADTGLRTDRLLSDVFVFEDITRPEGEARLTIMSDGGVNPAPTTEQKVQIILNAVEVAKALGIKNPKVAVLTASEKVSPKMYFTQEAEELTKMNQAGKIPGCIVYGPLALDIAICKEAAKYKNITSEVGGQADILLMPSIEAGNIFGKSLVYHGNREIGHVIKGAKAPILINSRTDTMKLKLNSIALGIICS